MKEKGLWRPWPKKLLLGFPRRALHGRFAFGHGPRPLHCWIWSSAYSTTLTHHDSANSPHTYTMTTRRIVGEERTFLENDPRGPPGPSNISPAVPA
jgi:hypothetical protein